MCRKGGSLPGGSISPTPLSLQARKEHLLLSSPRTGSGSLSSLAGKLQKISVEGGSAITLCNAANGRGGSWGEDGNIIAALSDTCRLVADSFRRRSANAGDRLAERRAHPPLAASPAAEARPCCSRLHTATNGFDGANIEVMSLADHRRKTLVRGGTFGRYLPSGHLVYVNRGTLFAVPFDVDRLEVHGTPAPVLDQVGYNAATGSAQLDFSQTGTLIYRSGGAGGGLLTVAWLDGAGKTQPLLAKPGAYGRPSHVAGRAATGRRGRRRDRARTSGSTTGNGTR